MLLSTLVERFDIEPSSDFEPNEQTLEGSFSSVSMPNFARSTHWKARDEIYKIYMLLHRSDLNISAKFHQTFSNFSVMFFAKFSYFRRIFIEFCSDFDENLSEFAKYSLKNIERQRS